MTTRHINPNITGLSPYRPGKPVDELTRELGITDVIKLASNENPRGPGAAVLEAIRGASGNLSRYPDGNGFVLKQALARQLGVGAEQITLGNGSNDVLDLVARMAIAPGASGVIADHAFVVYNLAITIAGGRVVKVPARDFGADLDAMRAAVTPDTAVVFLANPNNPTGTWVPEAELVRFLDALPPHVWMVLDEAYFEYVDVAGYPDGVKLLARYPNLIVTRTFSKIHGLAALRVGYAVSSPEAADLMNRVRQPFNVNTLGLAAATAALGDTAYVTESRALNKAGLAALTAGLEQLGLRYIPSVGNFVAFEPGRDAMAVYQALLREGVIVRPIAEYGLAGHLRVTVGLPGENQRFLQALSRVLE
ncbi:MAG: histidinol-phosphate transaminase [Pseudomonadales bacterium]|nr:histidinol-phosphate transaminase [Pseudomonadales bacterium]